LFVVLLSVAPITKVDAIDPGDGLHHGQELVDWATSLIDARVAEIRRGPQDGETLYGEIRGLVQWIPTYAEGKIAPQYRLEGPDGLMIQDAISDTLATRLHRVLAEYVKQNPDEILDRGREAFEIATSRVSLPPGRLLGFHLVHMAGLYVAQADTISEMPDLALPGVRDGFLRQVWDLCQIHEQIHATAAEKYFCRMSQEDWIAARIRCEKCGHRGFEFKNQMMGIREDTTAACQEIFDPTRVDPEVILERVECRHWGHIFTAKCPECGEIIKFSVALPYYKALQRELAAGVVSKVRLPEDRIQEY
jgi:hypothetical protein